MKNFLSNDFVKFNNYFIFYNAFRLGIQFFLKKKILLIKKYINEVVLRKKNSFILISVLRKKYEIPKFKDNLDIFIKKITLVRILIIILKLREISYISKNT